MIAELSPYFCWRRELCPLKAQDERINLTANVSDRLEDRIFAKNRLVEGESYATPKAWDYVLA